MSESETIQPKSEQQSLYEKLMRERFGELWKGSNEVSE